MTQKKRQKKPRFKSPVIEAEIFDRRIVRLRRDRIASDFQKYDFLNREITNRLIDNIQDIKRTFNRVLNLGCHSKTITDHFKKSFIVDQNLSFKMTAKADCSKIQADEEFLPLRDQSLDLVISCLNLHWVNDLPGTLVQTKHCLKPDGLFLGAFLGGETLTELRQSMLKADMEYHGGISPHISPFIDVRDAGSLMQRAGFALPVVNIEKITVTYSDAFSLMKELRGMGENNALVKRYKALTSPKLMLNVAKHYHADFALENGKIPATFNIIYMQGWAPHESQQKPLKPGSGNMFLKDALGKTPPAKV